MSEPLSDFVRKDYEVESVGIGTLARLAALDYRAANMIRSAGTKLRLAVSMWRNP